MITLIGWLATIAVLLAYFKGGRVFDWANALLWLLVAAPSAQRGVWSAVFISMTFGLIGAWNVIKEDLWMN